MKIPGLAKLDWQNALRLRKVITKSPDKIEKLLDVMDDSQLAEIATIFGTQPQTIRVTLPGLVVSYKQWHPRVVKELKELEPYLANELRILQKGNDPRKADLIKRCQDALTCVQFVRKRIENHDLRNLRASLDEIRTRLYGLHEEMIGTGDTFPELIQLITTANERTDDLSPTDLRFIVDLFEKKSWDKEGVGMKSDSAKEKYREWLDAVTLVFEAVEKRAVAKSELKKQATFLRQQLIYLDRWDIISKAYLIFGEELRKMERELPQLHPFKEPAVTRDTLAELINIANKQSDQLSGDDIHIIQYLLENKYYDKEMDDEDIVDAKKRYEAWMETYINVLRKVRERATSTPQLKKVAKSIEQKLEGKYRWELIQKSTMFLREKLHENDDKLPYLNFLHEPTPMHESSRIFISKETQEKWDEFVKELDENFDTVEKWREAVTPKWVSFREEKEIRAKIFEWDPFENMSKSGNITLTQINGEFEERGIPLRIPQETIARFEAMIEKIGDRQSLLELCRRLDLLLHQINGESWGMVEYIVNTELSAIDPVEMIEFTERYRHWLDNVDIILKGLNKIIPEGKVANRILDVEDNLRRNVHEPLNKLIPELNKLLEGRYIISDIPAPIRYVDQEMVQVVQKLQQYRDIKPERKDRIMVDRLEKMGILGQPERDGKRRVNKQAIIDYLASINQ